MIRYNSKRILGYKVLNQVSKITIKVYIEVILPIVPEDL